MHHNECFAVNRLLHIIWIEANRSVEEGVATPEYIDTACKLGLGHPIGPYTLMDLTGNALNVRGFRRSFTRAMVKGLGLDRF